MQRERTYLGGAIAFNARYSTMDCVIRNLSRNGAKLQLAGTATLPSEFDLVVLKTGQNRRARVIWRRADEIGVALDDVSGAGDVVSIETARKIRAIKAERDALAARLASVTEPA